MKCCGYCLNATVDSSLDSDNDLSYCDVGLSQSGYSMHIRSGNNKPTSLIVSRAYHGRNFAVAVYDMKYCPECGRRLFENG